MMHIRSSRMDGWTMGTRSPPAEFAKIAQEYSECPARKKGEDLGWFPHGKPAGPFQGVAFNTPVGTISTPFKSMHGYHFISTPQKFARELR
ncbi:hypothetical protein BS78_06G000600 [Paspalum vaginatum]|nr:hypothetical protein BS78_06G000600 [Paspalum vaginatum]KAJ1269743.1 hypothetical protein BS78_06G000600 [Paspalum vaginatum]